jgi:hypothetical protein
VFTFGDAKFAGSTGGKRLDAPAVAIVLGPPGPPTGPPPAGGPPPTPPAGGYWIATAGGSVFGFGTATSLGSAAGQRLGGPITGMTGTV